MAINEGQEVAKDLTMLKQDESAGEASLNELQENLPEGEPAGAEEPSFGGLPPSGEEPDTGVPSQEPVPGETELAVGEDGAIIDEGGSQGPSFGGNPFEINTLEAYETYKKNRLASQYAYANKEEGRVDVDLDRGRGLDEDRDVARARNQGTGTKLAKAVFGGIAQGGLIFAEEVGYFADVTGWADSFGAIDEMSGNWWTRKMKHYQEELLQSDTFKIYDNPADDNSITSQIFKWSSMQNTFGSAIGFGLSGAASGGLVKAATTAKRFSSLMGYLDKFLGAKTGTALAMSQGRGQQLASSGLANYFMGQMMAVDTYNITLDKLKTRVGTEEGQISMQEAKAIAATEAQDAIWLNMALMATSHLTFANVFKGTNKTKKLLSNPSAVNRMKEFTYKGAPTAFVENVYQEMIQMEQIYDAQIRANVKDIDHSKDFWTRAGELALSDRAVHAGAMGIAGGPIQFAMIQRPFMGEQIKEQKKAYKNQQQLVDWHKKVVAKDFETYREHRTNYLSSIAKGEKTLATLSEDMEIHSQLIKAAEWQYIDHLRNDVLKKIKDGTSELKDTDDYDANWKEKANQFLKDIDRVNELYQVTSHLTNTGDVVYNSMVTADVEKAKFSTDKEVAENLSKRDKEIVLRYPEEAKAISFDDKGKIVPLDITGMTEADAVKARVAHDRASNKINKYLETSETNSTLIKKQGESKKLTNLLEKLAERRKYLLSKEGQKAGAEQNTTNTEEINEKVAKSEAEANKEAGKDVADSTIKEDAEQEAYRDFKDVETAGIEKSKDRIAETDKQISERKATKGHLAFKDNSFSSTRANVRQVFTPNEIRVSKDGRYFKVLSQSKAKTDPTKESMPVLMEVEKKGSNYVTKDIRTAIQKKKGVKVGGNAFKFVLGDLGFLRSEALQAAYFKGSKKPTYYASYWSSYSDAYSPIKPADLDFNNRRVDYAVKGEATTINVPVKLREADKYRHLKEYDLDAFSKPFEGEYEVEVQIGKDPGGNAVLDVVRTEANGDKVKLPPLDPSYNMNFSAIYSAASKGVVKAKVIEHFSKGANIGNITDAQGNPVYQDVSNLKQLSNKFKHNGKLYLARTHKTSSKDLMRVAIDEEGNTYTGSIDGLAIPSIGQGDIAALIVGPGKKLIPIQLSAKNLDQVPSKDGDGTAIDDVINGSLEAIETAFEDVISQGVAKDVEILEKLRGTNKFIDDYNDDGTLDTESDFAGQRLSTAFKIEKSKSLTAYNKEFFDLMEKGPKQLISEVSDYQYLGKILVAGKLKAAVAENLNEFFFKLSYGVANDGTITPTIQKTVNGKKAYINYKDDPIGFKAALSQKRKKVSIEDMTSSDNEVSKRVWNEGLTTNLDVNNPIQGASATLKFDDTYIQEEGSKDAEVKMNSITPKVVSESFKETRSKAAEVAKVEALREFDAVYTDIVQMKDNLRNVLSLNDTLYNETEAKEFFYEIIGELGLSSMTEAKKIMREVFEADQNSRDTAEQIIIDEISQELKDVDVNKNIIVLGLHALTKINEKVQSGDIDLAMTTAYKNRSVDPKYIHSEGIDLSFPKGTVVFHRNFGEMKVKSRYSNNGRTVYTLEAKRKDKNGSPYIKTVKAFPSQVGLKNGLFRKLAKEQKRLRKKNISETEKTTVANNIFHLERRLQRSRGEHVEAIKKTEGSKGLENSELEYKESFQDVIDNLDVKAEFSEMNEKELDKAMKSQRAWDIARSVQHLEKLKEDFSVDPKKVATAEDVTAAQDVLKKMSFVTPKEILSLIKKAEAKDAKDDVIALKNGLSLINRLNDPNSKSNTFETLSIGIDGKEKIVKYTFPEMTYTTETEESGTLTESTPVIHLANTVNLLAQTIVLPMYMAEIVVNVDSYQEQFNPLVDSSSKNNDNSDGPTTSTGIRFNPNFTTSKPESSTKTGVRSGPPVLIIKKSERELSAKKIGISDSLFETIESFVEVIPADTAAIEVLKRINKLEKSSIRRTILDYGLSNIDPYSLTVVKDAESVLDVLESSVEKLSEPLYDIMDSDQRITYAKLMDSIMSADLDIPNVEASLHENFSKEMKMLGAKLNLLINTEFKVADNKIDSGYLHSLSKEGKVIQGVKLNEFLKKPKRMRSDELGFERVSELERYEKETGVVEWTDKEIAEAERVAGLSPSVREAHYEALRKKPKAKPKNKPKNKPTAEETAEELKSIRVLNAMNIPVEFRSEVAEMKALNSLDYALYSLFKDDFAETDRNLSDLTALLTEWSNNDMVEFDPNIGKPKFKEVEGSKYDAMNEASDVDRTTEAFKAEVAESKRMLPQVPIHIVANVTEMAKKYGNKAIGAWDNGVRYVVNNAEFGTVHHETFHAVADMYLTVKDKKKILKQLGKDKWSLEIEEKLARDFESFMKDKKSRAEDSKTAAKKSGIVNYIKNLFKDLVAWVKNSRGKDYTQKVFERIESGKYAKKASNLSNLMDGVMLNKSTDAANFKDTLSVKNRLILQNMEKSGQIIIKC